MSVIQADFENVLPFAASCLRRNVAVCLVTITGIDGVSPRPLGSQMVVDHNGLRFGMLTGGCAEQAIGEHAIGLIRDDRHHDTVRIGTDSPWVDIRLPCGSGIDLHFSVLRSENEAGWIFELLNLVAARQVALAGIDQASQRWALTSELDSAAASERYFVRPFLPSIRLMIVGAGPYVAALVRMAGEMRGVELEVYSHDAATLNEIPAGTNKTVMTPVTIKSWQLDQWTAVAVMFHEHDREMPALKAALASDCFYIGALGSRHTQSERRENLLAVGVFPDQTRRVSGPIGLDIGARTPDEIAVSVLAEIVQAKNQTILNTTHLNSKLGNAHADR